MKNLRVDRWELDTRRIEEAALNAWPAESSVLYDGWLLRFSRGYTRRANSVNALYLSNLEIDEKIPYCESAYRARGLLPVFRLTPQAQAEGLDANLAARGYLHASETLVQACRLDTWQAPASPPASLRSVTVDNWLDHFCAFKGQPLSEHRIHRAILESIPGARCLGLLEVAGQPVACGLGVQEGAYLGLFDLVTDPVARNRGYGRALISALFAWGQAAGAHLAYLQVESGNAPARHLYARLGFTDLYSYWYRVSFSGEGS